MKRILLFSLIMIALAFLLPLAFAPPPGDGPGEGADEPAATPLPEEVPEPGLPNRDIRMIL